MASDLYVLALPLSQSHQGLALLTFLGGVSAATGMVIENPFSGEAIDRVACATPADVADAIASAVASGQLGAWARSFLLAGAAA